MIIKEQWKMKLNFNVGQLMINILIGMIFGFIMGGLGIAFTITNLNLDEPSPGSIFFYIVFIIWVLITFSAFISNELKPSQTINSLIVALFAAISFEMPFLINSDKVENKPIIIKIESKSDYDKVKILDETYREILSYDLDFKLSKKEKEKLLLKNCLDYEYKAVLFGPANYDIKLKECKNEKRK